MQSTSFLETDRNGNSIEIDNVTLNKSKNVYKCKLNDGKEAAVKKIVAVDSTTVELKHHLKCKDFLKLKHDNVVSYHNCIIEGSVRFLVMDLCLGSMREFLGEKMSGVTTSEIEIDKIMWETVRGLEYLHTQSIVHGQLNLKKILLFSFTRMGERFITAKIAGYFPCNVRNVESTKIEDDLCALGRVFYSMVATERSSAGHIKMFSEEIGGHSVSLSELINLKDDQRFDAAELINLLLQRHSKVFSVNLLLKHPFFTINNETARHLLLNSAIFKNVKKEELETWRPNAKMAFPNFGDEDYNYLVDQLCSPVDNNEGVGNVLKFYSKLLFHFAWHLSLRSHHKETDFQSFERDKRIGRGSYGFVYDGVWTNSKGVKMRAACKEFMHDDDGKKEIKAIQSLDHVFVVKFLGTLPSINGNICLVMELCEGNLEDYVEKRLCNIVPKDTLNKLLLGQITLGLAYIHSKKMIHKDLKPLNILLWRNPSGSSLVVAKLADFNYAKEMRPSMDQFSKTEHPGTLSCMAPELMEPEKTGKVLATYKSDAFALGITIAYTVLGQHPYGSTEFIQQFLMKTGCEPTELKALEWDITHLILQLTRKEPKERPDVGLVIYHPYFILTNDNTTLDFKEKMNGYFRLYNNPNEIRRKVFDTESVVLWRETLETQIKLCKESHAYDDLFKSLDKYLPPESVRNASEYYLKISKEVVQNEGQIEKILDFSENCPFYSADRLIQVNPKFACTYLWCMISEESGVFPVNRNLAGKKPGLDQILNCFKMDGQAFCFLYDNQNKERATELLDSYKHSCEKQDKQTLLKFIWKLPYHTVPKETAYYVIDSLDDVNYKDESSGNTALHWALSNPSRVDVEIIRKLINKGADPSIVNNSGKSSIFLAAMNESDSALEVLELLLGGRNNNMVADDEGLTPLHVAAMNTSNEASSIVSLLIEKGACPQIESKESNTPVHYAAANESNKAGEIMNVLLKAGGNPNAANSEGLTALHVSVLNPSTVAKEIVEILLENGSNVGAKSNKTCRTPVHAAACSQSDCGSEIMKLLLEKADPNIESNFGVTPLHLAAYTPWSSATSIVQILLENGANPNAESMWNDFRYTPIHVAAYNKSDSAPDILKQLLTYKGSSEVTVDFDPNVSYLAAMNSSNRSSEIMEILLERGLNPNQRPSEEYPSFLYMATCNNNLNMVNKLLEKKANPNVKHSDGSPLHAIAAIGDCESDSDILKALLENKGDPSVVDDNGNTPLHLAAGNESSLGSKLILQILQDERANPNAVNKDGLTPLHLAAHNKSDFAISTVELLVERGSHLDACCNDGNIPLHYAAFNTGASASRLVKFLLEKNKHLVNTANKIGLTPLHFVAVSKSTSAEEITKLLLDHGGIASAKCQEDRTPIHYAARNLSCTAPNVTQLLLENGGDPNDEDKFGLTPLRIATTAISDDDFYRSMIKEAKRFSLRRKQKLINEIEENEEALAYVPSSRVEIVKLLLRYGGNPDSVAGDGRTPVHAAAADSSIQGPEIMKLLLDNEGNPNAFNTMDGDETPLHVAVRKQTESSLNILRCMLENRGNPNVIDGNGESPLHLAVLSSTCNGYAIVELLLSFGGDPNLQDNLGETPLHAAARNRSAITEAITGLLLQKGAIIDMTSVLGTTPLHVAASNTSVEGPKIVKLLLERGEANPNVNDILNRTPVHVAASNESETAPLTMKHLLLYRGDPNEVDNVTRATPTHIAAANQSKSGPALLKLLLDHGAFSNCADNRGETPLHLAVRNRALFRPEIVRLLLDKEANTSFENVDGETPLHLAFSAKNPNSTSETDEAVAELLLDNGANPNCANKITQRTPVHAAAKYDSPTAPNLMSLLLKFKGDCNAADKYGLTAIHVAALSKSSSAPAVLELMLKRQGDPNRLALNSMSPLYLASLNYFSSGTEIVKLLLKYGGNPNASNNEKQRTPIHAAAQNKSKFAPDIMKLLLEHNGEPNAIAENGITPLHLASANSSVSAPRIVAYLLRKGANREAKDNDGQTPMMIASSQTESEVAYKIKRLLCQQ